MGAFDNDAFAVTAFSTAAFSMDAGPPPPPLASLPGNAALDIMRIKRHRTTSKGAR
jgi:hypothetical protein